MIYMWLVLIIITGIAEAVTAAMVSIWFTIGALCGLIGAALNLSITWQVILFFVGTGVSLLISKPLVKKGFKLKGEKTNYDRLIGKKALVTETIDEINSKGQVKIEGLVWSAKSADLETINEGNTVTVSDIKGVHLIVKK